jgi:3-oxoacyl-[acyl-carrier protein] reductase
MALNAIIIGGTSGIGLETARYLNAKGYSVTIGARAPVYTEEGINYLPIDVTNESTIENFFLSLPYDKIDSIIYTAGTTTSKKSITDFTVDEYRRVHDVNLLGAILILKHAFPFLKKAKGKVVIVSSFAARTFSRFSGFEYTISKAGLSGMVKQLAVEWANDGVLINTIFPSMVDTPMLRENVDSSVLEIIENGIPLGRIAESEDIAAAIEFLVSERNSYITGSGLDINGGQFLSG